MKLAYPQLQSVLDTEIAGINTLVIENKDFFVQFLNDIVAQIDGMTGQAVLSLDGDIIEISKYVEVLDRFVPFEINKKNLLNKILHSFEKTSLDEEHFEATQKLLIEIENYMDDIAFAESCDIMCTKVSISNLIRSVGIEIRDEYESLGEKVLDYMEMVRAYDHEKLFIFVNFRSYMPDDKLDLFIKSALSKGLKFILIDSAGYEILPSEKRITIDKDLCEF